MNTIHARSRYWRRNVNELGHSFTHAGQYDNCQNYEDAYNTIFNPLATFGHTDQVGEGRGVGHHLTILTNTATSASVELEV